MKRLYTAVSSLMILLNEFEKVGKITKKDFRTFVILEKKYINQVGLLMMKVN